MDAEKEIDRILNRLTLKRVRQSDKKRKKEAEEEEEKKKEEAQQRLERLEGYFEREPEEAHPDPSPEGAEKVQEKGQRKRKWYGKSKYA